MPGYNVGQAYIQISPSFDGFANELTSRMRVAGDQGARDFARAFVEQLRRSTRNANIGPGAAALGQQGAAGGAKFAESFKATVEAALRSLPDITIDADTSDAQREIAEVKARLEALSRQEIGIDITSGEAVAEMNRIRDELKRLGAESTDIDVKIDTGRARANLDELRAEIARVNGDEAKVNVRTDGARGEVKLLGLAIASLVPAAAVAGVAVGGALAGVAPAAGTAVLAVLGIRDAYKSGALDGTSFAESIVQGNDALTQLKTTAAAGILPGLDQGLQGLLGQLSPVNSLVDQFSRQMGAIAGTTGPALASILTQLQPLFTTVGNLLQIGANKLATFATSGDGVKKFSDFILANLPNVLDTLGEVAGAFIKIVQAVAPIGQIVLSTIGVLADVISAIPVDVLTGLVTGILALYAAFKVLVIIPAIINGINVALAALAANPIGAVLAIVGAIAAVAFTLSSTTDDSQAATEAMNAYSQSVKTSTDALNAANIAATRKQLSDKGALSTLNALHDANQALGLSYNDLAKAVNGTDKEAKSVRDTLSKVVAAKGLNSDAGFKATQLANQLATLRGGFKDARDEQERYIQSLGKGMTDLDSVSRGTGIAADQVKQYAQMLGLTVTEQGLVSGSSATVTAAIRTVASAYGNANQTGSAYLDALNTFSSSARTAADRATLIGATLRAANGDALNYAGQMNGAAVAQKQFADSIKQAAEGVGKNGVSTGAYLRSIINLKTGTIDYKNAAAAPLITSLQGIQNASINAAKAAYQHAVGVKGGKAAADEAYRVYVSQTKGQLIDEAQKLGLTEGQAKKLAKAYLNTPKQVKTLIEQQGANPVVDILTQIRNLLGAVTGHPFKTALQLKAEAAQAALTEFERKVRYLDGKTIRVGTVVSGGGPEGKGSYVYTGPGRASGGSAPEGMFAVGERGPEIVSKRGSDVQILSNAQSKAFVAATGARFPGFANGTMRGFASGTSASNYAAIASLLKSLGATRQGIAGFLGNTKVESGGSTKAYNPRENAVGLQQFEGGRLTSLKNIARKLGVSIYSQVAQLALIKKELTGPYRDTLRVLQRAKSAGAAAAYVDAHYEVSSGDARGARIAAARQFDQQLKSGRIRADGSGSVAGGRAVRVPVLPVIPAPALSRFAASAAKAVQDQIAAAVRTPDTSIGTLSATLRGTQTTATGKQQRAEQLQAVYLANQARANRLDAAAKKASTRVTLERTALGGDANKLRDRAAKLRDQADAVQRSARTKAEKKAAAERAKSLRSEAAELSRAAATAGRASSSRLKALQAEAARAAALAAQAKKAAAAAKTAYGTAASAAKDATSAAQDAAKNLVDAVKTQVDDLTKAATEFRASVVTALTQNAGLGTLYGKVSDLVASITGPTGLSEVTSATASSAVTMEQAAASLAAAGANLDQAQARLSALQTKIATAGGTPDDYTALAAAQRGVTDALNGLTAAQKASADAQSSTSETTALTGEKVVSAFRDQLTAATGFAADITALIKAGLSSSLVQQVAGLGAQAGGALARSILESGPSMVTELNALATQAANAVRDAVGPAALQQQFAETLRTTQTFAADLQALVKIGAGQDVINQVLALGPEAGDGLAKSLLQAGPKGVAALQASMKQISDVAAKAGDSLTGTFYLKGQQTMLQLVAGLKSQYPYLVAELNKITADLQAQFVASGGTLPATPKTTTPTKTTTTKTPTKTTAAKNPIVKKTGTFVDRFLPKFATGVADFTGPAAYVHAGELLINNKTPGLDVLTARQVDSLRDVVNYAKAQPIAAPLAASSSGTLTNVRVYIGDEAIDPRMVRISHDVLDSRVDTAQSRHRAGVRGNALDHLGSR